VLYSLLLYKYSVPVGAAVLSDFVTLTLPRLHACLVFDNQITLTGLSLVNRRRKLLELLPLGIYVTPHPAAVYRFPFGSLGRPGQQSTLAHWLA
jgi:hypothetical protein